MKNFKLPLTLRPNLWLILVLAVLIYIVSFFINGKLDNGYLGFTFVYSIVIAIILLIVRFFKSITFYEDRMVFQKYGKKSEILYAKITKINQYYGFKGMGVLKKHLLISDSTKFQKYPLDINLYLFWNLEIIFALLVEKAPQAEKGSEFLDSLKLYKI